MTLALALIVALAFAVEGALGFGSTVIAVTLGAFLAPLDALLPALVPLNLVLSALIVRESRADVDGARLKRALPLLIVGLPFGAFAGSVVDGALLVRSYGAVVVVLGLAALAKRALLPSKLALAAAGVIHGAFGTGGPLVVVALGHALEPRVLRATLGVVWLVLNVLLLAALAVSGAVDGASALLSLELAPALVVGLVVGGAVRRRVPVDVMRKATWVMLVVAGAALALR